MRRWLTVSLLLTFLIPCSNAQASYNTNNAQTYLLAHADNPWSTMALSALHATSISSDYLKSVNGASAIEYAAPILAITVLNHDPRTFGATDYVAALKNYDVNNQIGDSATVNDDIFGLLALLSAGLPSSDQVVTDAKNFILAHQQTNGGWGFATSGGTDSNMTASAIVALVADGIAETDPIIQNGLNYLKTAQNDDGGFTYDPQSPFGTDSDSSSTAWVIWALNSARINPADWSKSNHTPIEYLESNQDPSGYFKYQTGSSEDSFSATATSYAVIALLGKTLPLNIFAAPPASYNLTYVAGPNGSLTGSATQTVNSGANGTAVVAVPAIGFHFNSWSDGVLAASRTDSNVTANITITASFVADIVSGGGSSGFIGGNLATTPQTPRPALVPAPIPKVAPSQTLGTVTFAQGALVKTADSYTVYIVAEGKFRPFSSEKIFFTYGLKFSDVQIIGSDIINADNPGAIMDYPDGTPHE